MLLPILKKQCPFCHKGALVDSENRIRPSCESCGRTLLADPGDLWFFLLILDRALFLFPIIIAIYFGLNQSHFWFFLFLCALMGGVLFKTIELRNRICFFLMLLLDKKKAPKKGPF